MAVDKSKIIENHPQAKDDAFAGGENTQVILDVMANDLGGAGKALYSVHQSQPATVSMTGLSAMGAQVSIADGKITYVANSASINALAQGQSATDTFTYTIQMGNNGALATATVSVTVTGTNDAPVVSGVVAGTAVEDGPAVTLSGLANASDVDAGTTLNVVGVPAVLPAGVSFNAAANTFTLNPAASAYQSLGVGQTTTVTVGYSVSDGVTATPGSVSWIITGTNDGPVAVADTGAAIEDGGAVVVSVLANDTDVDTGDTKTLVSVSTAGATGSVTANLDGTVTYNPGAAFQNLGAGQTATDTFAYTMKDAAGVFSTATVTMTITGTNDGPVAVADTGAAVEDGGAVVVNVLGNDTDVDNGDTKTLVSVSTAGTTGSVTANPDGTVTYNPGANFQSLCEGQTATDTFTYTMRDAAGALSTATVTMTIAGTHDGPPFATVSGEGVITLTQTGPYTLQFLNNGAVNIIYEGCTLMVPSPTGFDAASFAAASVSHDSLQPINLVNLTFAAAGPGGGFEPSVNLTALLDRSLSNQSGDALHGLFGQYEVNGGAGDLIKVLWDYLDDPYVGEGNYYNTARNEAFVRLGVEYARYLEDGGAPFTNVAAKFAPDTNGDGIPQRLQSLHDNLLGNITNFSIDSRNFPTNLKATLKSLVGSVGDGEYSGRYSAGAFDGTQGALGNGSKAHDQARAFDWDHGWERNDWLDITANGKADVRAQETPTSMHYGTGNPIDDWTLVRHEGAGVELGLKIKHRGGDEYPEQPGFSQGPLGAYGVYKVLAGPAPGAANRAEWSFDFAVTRLAAGDDEANLTFKVWFDTDPTASVRLVEYPLINQYTAPYGDQNSHNYGFVDIDPNTPGQQIHFGDGDYEIRLEAYLDGVLIAQNVARVLVGDGIF